MSPDPFVHLHVASGYSLQYGASHPHVLVERAVEQEMDTLALTDRDGTYGAVKFAKACLQAGIRPVLGVDLAYRRLSSVDVASRSERVETTRPVRARPCAVGAFRDPRLPRVTFLARGRAGWAAICRLVSATHLAGERGSPVVDLDLRRRAPRRRRRPGAARPGLRARARRRPGAATTWPWPRWRPGGSWCPPRTSSSSWSPTGCPGSGGDWGPGTSPHAARMAGVARRAGLGAVLTNAVRYADRLDAPTVDVLDAARRLVALDRRHVDRGNAEGFLKSGKQMHEVAEEICRLAGLSTDTGREARRLLARTRAVADRCALDPRADLGLGEVHFPEFELSGTLTRPKLSGGSADGLLRARCEGAIGDRYGSAPRAADLEAPRRRARDDPRPRLRVVLPHRRRRHRPDPRDGGALRGPRLGGRAAWSTTCSASPGSTRSGTAC